MAVTKITTEVWEAIAGSLLARVRSTEGKILKTSDLGTIVLSIFDITDSDNIVANVGNPISVLNSVIQPNLMKGEVWEDVDSVGYNFKYDYATSQVPDPDKIYRFEFTITPTGSEATLVVFELVTCNQYTDD